MITGCGTDKYLIGKSVNGYLTFKGVDFHVVDDQIIIVLDYIPHGIDPVANYFGLADSIKQQLEDVTSKSDVASPTTTFSDSVYTTTITVQDYYHAGILFSNLNRRLRLMAPASLQSQLPNFNFSIRHLSGIDRAVFRYTRYLFEPKGLIIFKADEGNLHFKPKDDQPTLDLVTSGYTNAEYMITATGLDSTFRNGVEKVIFDFNPPPLPWYSWQRIRTIFSSSDQKLPSETDLKHSNFNSDKNQITFGNIWQWIKDQIAWIAGFCGILSFLYVFIDHKKGRKRG